MKCDNIVSCLIQPGVLYHENLDESSIKSALTIINNTVNSLPEYDVITSDDPGPPKVTPRATQMHFLEIVAQSECLQVRFDIF